jgi:hypothetical protein
LRNTSTAKEVFFWVPSSKKEEKRCVSTSTASYWQRHAIKEIKGSKRQGFDTSQTPFAGHPPQTAFSWLAAVVNNL